jgi:hypothetical protein
MARCIIAVDIPSLSLLAGDVVDTETGLVAREIGPADARALLTRWIGHLVVVPAAAPLADPPHVPGVHPLRLVRRQERLAGD